MIYIGRQRIPLYGYKPPPGVVLWDTPPVSPCYSRYIACNPHNPWYLPVYLCLSIYIAILRQICCIPLYPAVSRCIRCVIYDVLTPAVYPPPNTAADTAHSAHSTQPALRPHRATPRVEDNPPETRRPHSIGLCSPLSEGPDPGRRGPPYSQAAGSSTEVYRYVPLVGGGHTD